MQSPTIRLFGSFSFFMGETCLSAEMPLRIQELLAYLLIHRNRSQQRSQIAGLFWPDSSEEQARTNLRNTLYTVRRSLPAIDSYLISGYQSLQWQPEQPLDLDVERFEQHISLAAPASGGDLEREQMELREAVQCYTSDLLVEFYADWVEPERNRLRFLFQTALTRLADLLAKQQDYTAAIFYARQMIQQEPLAENAYCQLMRLEAQAGNLAGVRQVYQQCQLALNQELSASPSPQTVQLYQSLVGVSGRGSLKMQKRPIEQARKHVSWPLVGREQEWRRLQEQVAAMHDGQARMILIRGEIGTGKTRLLEEVALCCPALAVTTASAHCYLGEGNLELSPVREWLQQLSPEPLESIWMNDVALLLPEYASLSEDSDLPPATGLERGRFFEALARFVLQVQGPAHDWPLVLLIDDLQWCDHDTLEWIHFLLRYAPRSPLLLIGALRTGGERGNPALQTLLLGLQSTDSLVEYDIDGLRAAETGRLVAQISHQPMDPAHLERLQTESEGIPLVTIELIQSGWPKLAAGYLPARYSARVLEAASRLSPEALRVAQILAVAGRALSYDGLIRIVEMPEDSLAMALEELLDAHLVREDCETYGFAHQKIGPILKAKLGVIQTRRISLRLAQTNSASLPVRLC